jgi:hypothetical protein
VATYLAGALGASGSVDWTDRQQPGGEGFKLRSVQILDEDSKPVSVVNIERPLRVRIEYLTERPSMRFRVSASFNTAGVSAFHTMQPSESLHDRPGIYAAVVTVPGNLLAEGEYSIGVSAFASRGSKAHMCLVKSVVAFQVYDPVTGTSARGDFGERYAGVLRPLLPWQTEQIDAVRR